jgi:oligoribonuclease
MLNCAMSIEKLVWLDLEMTGLNPAVDQIIEIATIITTPQLEIIAYGPNLTIEASAQALANMAPVVKEMHQASGLLQQLQAQEHLVPLHVAEQATLVFLQQHLAPNSSPLCGNSIYQDRRFLHVYMPKLEAFFHYRNLDVSSFKIACQIWQPQLFAALPTKQSSHRAQNDVLESIAELQYYQRYCFHNATS